MTIFIKGKPSKYVRQRVCSTCGKSEEVRKDNKATTCGECSRRSRIVKANSALAEKREAARTYRPCANCGKKFHVVGGRTVCCSIECKRALQASSRIIRICKKCGKEFSVLRSALSGKTNASANFCGRDCYHKWMANEERTKHYGPRWKRLRDAAKKVAPYCAICGTFNGIDMHHIVPYRVQPNNDHLNLVALCKKHHKTVEIATQEILAAGGDIETLWLVMHTQLTQYQEATFQKLKSIGYRSKYEPRFSI